MAIYNPQPSLPRYTPLQGQSTTYPMTSNSNNPSKQSLTMENAALHSQLITLQRTVTRQSKQLQAQADKQDQIQVLYGQTWAQSRNLSPGSNDFLSDPESVLREAMQDIHAAIRGFANMYAVRNWDADRKEIGNRKTGVAWAWSEVPSVLKGGVREVSRDGDRDRERIPSLPIVMKQSSDRRRDSNSRSSSNSNSRGGSRDRDRHRENESNSGGTLLAALLTREVYLAMWENAFFLTDEPNAVREKYRARKDGEKRGDRRRSTGSSGEVITRSTILADTFRDLWNYSPPQAESWRTQYFSIIHQELISTSSNLNTNTPTSFQPNSSSIQRKISSYANVFVSSFFSGELSPLLMKFSPRDEVLMQQSLHGIICSAARLFLRLRAQRCGLVVGEERELLRERFRVGNALMVVVGAESGRVDERRCDGGRVDIVVSPVTYVVEEGVGGSRSKKVLVKAVVVVGDDI
ncbi:uncharacterized protein RSE6_03793 [Rhynchosporium secalis]|uniref:Uncharacterized protein n=1 Tax=Rhynchosporium secalis TaxID=38038 RepID=A0A1E1M3P5_RHYSE|nr:uncharacterized protein RSE6_03793 [Rhynchosporium secalis]